jgi:hypothetical protein
MVISVLNSDYRDSYEYHGNTSIERVRWLADAIVAREWFYFDSVEEAEDYFYEKSE